MIFPFPDIFASSTYVIVSDWKRFVFTKLLAVGSVVDAPHLARDVQVGIASNVSLNTPGPSTRNRLAALPFEAVHQSVGKSSCVRWLVPATNILAGPVVS
jgi:hypothetical protein